MAGVAGELPTRWSTTQRTDQWLTSLGNHGTSWYRNRGVEVGGADGGEHPLGLGVEGGQHDGTVSPSIQVLSRS